MKKFLIIFKGKVFKIIAWLILLILTCYVFGGGIKKARDFEIYKKPILETKIYSIWHIETFEGGGVPRINYLKKIAREIEEKNKDVLFMINSIEPEKLDEITDMPDILSFGFGVGKKFLNSLINLSETYDVRDELIESGSFNGKLYALPYILSGYALITQKENNEFHCGESSYLHPEKIYEKQGLTPEKKESFYEAYKSFVYSDDVSVLGSGRDVFRVNNLNNLGRKNATIYPINSYTDLIQYIAITRQDKFIDLFLKNVFDKANQQSLANYSLFSALHGKVYSSGIYNDMENAILNCEIARVFYE